MSGATVTLADHPDTFV